MPPQSESKQAGAAHNSIPLTLAHCILFEPEPLLHRTLFVINPIAGGGRALKAWAVARAEVIRRGLRFSEHFTAGRGDAALATRHALEMNVPQVVAVGGDGTLNEVVNGYLDSNGRPVNPEARLAILSCGTR